jgi:putative oxidoreductase
MGEKLTEADMRSLHANLDTARPYILSIVRIIVALLFLQHGLQKYFAFPSAGPPMRPILHAQGLIEIIGGVLLFLGVYTRLVAFVLAGDTVAYFLAHAPRSFFPAVNGGDAAVLYCFIFFYMVFAGGGRWSLDRAMLGRD